MMEFTDEELDALSRACHSHTNLTNRAMREPTIVDLMLSPVYRTLEQEYEATHGVWGKIERERERRTAVKQGVSVAG